MSRAALSADLGLPRIAEARALGQRRRGRFIERTLPSALADRVERTRELTLRRHPARVRTKRFGGIAPERPSRVDAVTGDELERWVHRIVASPRVEDAIPQAP